MIIRYKNIELINTTKYYNVKDIDNINKILRGYTYDIALSTKVCKEIDTDSIVGNYKIN